MRARAGANEREVRGRPAASISPVLRLLAAALVGGAILLLWSAGADARTAAPAAGAPTPAPSTGPVGDLLSSSGPLAPVVGLVDPHTGGVLTSTLDGVSATVDPLVTTVTGPIATVTDPVVDGVVHPTVVTVASVVTTATGAIASPPPANPAPDLPGRPGVPDTPGLPGEPAVPDPGFGTITRVIETDLPPVRPGTGTATTRSGAAPGSPAERPSTAAAVPGTASDPHGATASGAPARQAITATAATPLPVAPSTPSAPDRPIGVPDVDLAGCASHAAIATGTSPVLSAFLGSSADGSAGTTANVVDQPHRSCVRAPSDDPPVAPD
ncbi:hypothetical protein [Aquihabitans sp. McL0605]|uniref:hypothetical protein n=1 Tax=Aquihabitans sp. McL0605 TaxID=3415671 RepID=UPI003CF48C15